MDEEKNETMEIEEEEDVEDVKQLSKEALRKLNKYINGFFGLGELNYIKPFRRLIHMLLFRIHRTEKRLDEIEDSPTMEEFNDLEGRVTVNEENIADLQENKADKEDLEETKERVKTLEDCCETVQEKVESLEEEDEHLQEQITENAENIADLQENKADKEDLEAYEEQTDGRLDTLEDHDAQVKEHLHTIDGRLDTDEENIDTLLDNMIELTGHDGIIATDTYFEDVFDLNLDGLLHKMTENGIMEYIVYTCFYDSMDNWVSQVRGAVIKEYEYEWNNYAFIKVTACCFGGTSPRPQIELIPRERDVYICMDYTGDDFVGHCFLHRTDTKEIEERIDNLFEIYETLAKRVSTTESLLEQEGESLSDHQSRILALEECCESVDEKLSNMETKVDEAAEKADAAEEAAKTAEETASGLDERVTTLEECCESVDEKLSNMETKVDEAAEKADAAEEAAKTAEETASGLDERVTTLEECCESVDEKLSNMETKVDEAAEKADAAEEAAKTAEETASGLDERVTTLEECCESVEEELSTLDGCAKFVEYGANGYLGNLSYSGGYTGMIATPTSEIAYSNLKDTGGIVKGQGMLTYTSTEDGLTYSAPITGVTATRYNGEYCLQIILPEDLNINKMENIATNAFFLFQLK